MAISEDDLKSIREEYEDHPLESSQLRSDPLKQFEYWFSQALEAQVMEPNAMVLATSKLDTPKARYVLFKGTRVANASRASITDKMKTKFI